VRFRSPAAVEALLEHGATVDQVCKRNGSTALHRAVTSTGAPGTAGKTAAARQIIELLLRYGADASIANHLGKKAADYLRDPELKRLFGG
jgi:tankyrase